MTCKPCCVKVAPESSCSSEQETVATPEGYDLPPRFALVPRQAVPRGRKATVPAPKHVVQVQGRGQHGRSESGTCCFSLGKRLYVPTTPLLPSPPRNAARWGFSLPCLYGTCHHRVPPGCAPQGGTASGPEKSQLWAQQSPSRAHDPRGQRAKGVAWLVGGVSWGLGSLGGCPSVRACLTGALPKQLQGDKKLS